MLEVSCKELNKSFVFLPSGLAATQLALLSLSEEKTWALLFFGLLVTSNKSLMSLLHVLRD